MQLTPLDAPRGALLGLNVVMMQQPVASQGRCYNAVAGNLMLTEALIGYFIT